MRSLIVLLGDVPDKDLDLFRAAAMKQGFEIEVLREPKASELTIEGKLPLGYLSFFPCTLQTIIELFGNLPLGAGESIPFFQLIDKPEMPEFLHELPILGVFESPLSKTVICNILHTISRNQTLIQQNQKLVSEVINYRNQKINLVKIGTALSSESNLQVLLERILAMSRNVLCADAGSIYIRQRKVPGGAFSDTLLFKVSQNDSVDIGRLSEYPIPINSNFIAGYVALTGRPLNIVDVNKLDDTVPYRTGKDFEKRFGYRIKSMLTVPLNNFDREVVGVLQLINKKRDNGIKLNSVEQVEDDVDAFTLSDEDFVLSVASQAAVSIERVQLHENIKALFEGFLSSSIAAIDERDKVTSGHSRRVMGYTMAFLDAALQEPDCPYFELSASPERRRQIKFAALLHDIGKIGVPEYLLTKESRLSNGEIAALVARIDFVELQFTIDPLLVSWDSREQIESDREVLVKVNESGFLDDQLFNSLCSIKEKTYTLLDGSRKAFLSDHEWQALSVRRGNLTSEERDLINSHALSTYRILSKIPWTKHLELIPSIASQHHERIDGSGYPDGLPGEKIQLESKIMAVVDIYEALVAQDRPYKPKMSPEKALNILCEEAQRGRLDKEIVKFFMEKGVYKVNVD